MPTPVIGLLALQGAFREHGQALARLGASPREVRQVRDLAGIDAIVIPGGESTTIGKLLRELGMLDFLKSSIQAGMPAFGTCAGLILLSSDIEGSSQPRLGNLDVKVRRNAFGRQVDSFEADLPVTGLDPEPFPAVFIRAPVILETGENVQTLAHVMEEGEERPVAVRQGNILATSFHPELTADPRLHRYFLKMCGFQPQV